MSPVADLEEVRTKLVDGLPASHRAWLSAAAPVTLHENTAIVAVPDDFTRSQLETRLRPRIEQTLSELLGQDVRLAVTVDPTLTEGDRRHDDGVHHPHGMGLHRGFGGPAIEG